MSDFGFKFFTECEYRVSSIKGLPFKQMELLKKKAHKDNLQKFLELGKEEQLQVINYISMDSFGKPANFDNGRYEKELERAKERLVKYDYDIKVMELL